MHNLDYRDGTNLLFLFGLICLTSLVTHRLIIETLEVTPSVPVEQVCPVSNTYITNSCPEYDKGWEEALAAECPNPTTEELRSMCQDLEELGYVPDC